MTERVKFECDVCGDVHGHLTDMAEYDIVWEPSHAWKDGHRETLHACISCTDSYREDKRHLIGITSVEEWYVEREKAEAKVVGCSKTSSIHAEWREEEFWNPYTKWNARFIEEVLL